MIKSGGVALVDREDVVGDEILQRVHDRLAVGPRGAEFLEDLDESGRHPVVPFLGNDGRVDCRHVLTTEASSEDLSEGTLPHPLHRLNQEGPSDLHAGILVVVGEPVDEAAGQVRATEEGGEELVKHLPGPLGVLWVALAQGGRVEGV